jgi:periplasmic protein TonB
MFNKLVASSGRKRSFWTAKTALTSIVFHGLLVVGVVYAGTGYDPGKKAREELVDFMELKEDKAEPKPEEPKPEPPPPPEPEKAPPPVVKGFQELQPPQEVPKEIVQPVNDQAVNAEDFSGQGKAGGVAQGVDNGVAQNTAQRESPPDQGVYDVSAVEERPELRNRAAVVSALQRNYPPLLRDAGMGGTVQVQLVVNEDGTPDMSTVEIISTDHEQFADAARRVVERMRFRPAKVNNQAVKVKILIPVTFAPG